jgi:phosphatidylserine decarboxylase
MGISTLMVAVFINPVMHLVTVAGIICLMLSAFLANFFRDPDRVIPKDAGILVSPADGHVMFAVRERATGRRPSKEEQSNCENHSLTGDWHPEACEETLSFQTEQRWEPVEAGEEADDDCWRVAVFMSPLDVHVNRACEAGTIVAMEHRTGKAKRRGPFLPAFKKESEFNERVRTVLETESGIRVEMTQISGAVARTIVPWTGVGTILRRGERYGMIRVGSRVDLRAPANIFKPVVIGAESNNPDYPKGQFVSAGSTILFKALIEESE